MLSLIGIGISIAVSVIAYIQTRDFVRRRLRYVDKVQTPIAPWIAGLAVALMECRSPPFFRSSGSVPRSCSVPASERLWRTACETSSVADPSSIFRSSRGARVTPPSSLPRARPAGQSRAPGARALDAALQTFISMAAMISILRRAALAVALLAFARGDLRAQGTAPTHGLDRANIDTTCAACADFYEYANGGWLKRTEIPAAYSSYGTFREVADRGDVVLRSVLEDAAKGSSDHATNEAGIYYATCMDTVAIEKRGVAPLEPRLASINAISSLPALRAEVAQLQLAGVPVMFNSGSEPDFKNSARVILALDQGGLGLPDRDYYTRTDSISTRLRTTYRDHVGQNIRAHRRAHHGSGPRCRSRAGDRDAAREGVVDESGAARSEEALQSHDAGPGRLAGAPFGVSRPFFATRTRRHPRSFASGIRSFLRTLDSMLTAVPLTDWKTYLRFHALSEASPWLSKPFADEAFRMQQAMTGAEGASCRAGNTASPPRQAISARPWGRPERRAEVRAGGEGARARWCGTWRRCCASRLSTLSWMTELDAQVRARPSSMRSVNNDLSRRVARLLQDPQCPRPASACRSRAASPPPCSRRTASPPATRALIEGLRVRRRPPVPQISLRVELAALVVEAVRHLVPDRRADAP